MSVLQKVTNPLHRSQLQLSAALGATGVAALAIRTGRIDKLTVGVLTVDRLLVREQSREAA
ncbi:MAG TPA: hypothetical protein VKE70_20365 [Candidatus Solibacter sp.]|nr:hypothetical protein [Candidatus Solibacter sp.]